MGKLPHKSSDGTDIVFDEESLEEAMKPYLLLRHTIDESRKRKKRTGYLIFAKNTDFKDIPYIPYLFLRWTDARFVIELLHTKIPDTERLNLYIKRLVGNIADEIKARVRMTKYEVNELDNEARESIWLNFV